MYLDSMKAINQIAAKIMKVQKQQNHIAAILTSFTVGTSLNK